MCTERPLSSLCDQAHCAAKGVVSAYRTCFPAEPWAIRAALADVRARFAGNLSAGAFGAAELALAEVLNNVAEHGYADMPPGAVTVCLGLSADSLHVRIEDRGHPMPGGRLPSGLMPEVAHAVEDLAEGGWGWALIRELTADLAYERRTGHNLLTFRIPLAAGG
ncbi:MAG: ATP-binding protein [Rhodobacteraceae bacterium]|nr:ATP-binding protein [Paracoccaceae bacterium]